MGRGDKDHQIQFVALPVDYHYLRTMGIKVVEGRDFTEHDGDCYIINETARKKWDWVEMDKKLLDNDYPVIGVCEDIRYASTRKDRHQEPLAFIILGESFSGWGDQLGVAISVYLLVLTRSLLANKLAMYLPKWAVENW